CSAGRNASMSDASLPEYTTLKFRPRLVTSASSLVTNDGSPARNWPLSPDSVVLNWSAYLLRLFQSRTSGCSVASHGGTYQPMIPLLPVWPASTAVFSVSMYFVTSSGWPQFSRTTSTSPLAKPCHAISSLRFL